MIAWMILYHALKSSLFLKTQNFAKKNEMFWPTSQNVTKKLWRKNVMKKMWRKNAFLIKLFLYPQWFAWCIMMIQKNVSEVVIIFASWLWSSKKTEFLLEEKIFLRSNIISWLTQIKPRKLRHYLDQGSQTLGSVTQRFIDFLDW